MWAIGKGCAIAHDDEAGQGVSAGALQTVIGRGQSVAQHNRQESTRSSPNEGQKAEALEHPNADSMLNVRCAAGIDEREMVVSARRLYRAVPFEEYRRRKGGAGIVTGYIELTAVE